MFWGGLSSKFIEMVKNLSLSGRIILLLVAARMNMLMLLMLMIAFTYTASSFGGCALELVSLLFLHHL